MILFQFGSFVFPNRHIKYDTFDIAPNQRQDLDSYTDGYGVTQRNALAHTKTQIKFTTLGMSGAEMDAITSGLAANYINYNERDANCTYYDPESRTTKNGHFYLDPSVQLRIKQWSDSGGVAKYGETQWTFIEY